MSGSSSSPNQLSNEALLAAITQGFSEVKLAIADLAASKKSNSGKGKGAAPPAVNGGVSPLQASGVVSADGAVKNITNRELETKKPSFPNINIYCLFIIKNLLSCRRKFIVINLRYCFFFLCRAFFS